MRFTLAILLIFICSCTSVHSKDSKYKVLINGNEECKYDYGDEDFCSKDNLIIYSNTSKTINFDRNKVLVVPEDRFGHIVVINPKDKIVYPFKYLVDYKKISFAKNDNEFCIEGNISAYRDEDNGYLCFEFTEDNFKQIYDMK